MSKGTHRDPGQIDRLFAGLGARGDRWRNLVELAEAWSNGSGDRAKFEAALAELTATEEYRAYPGSQLMAALRDHAAENDAPATASLARLITRAILTRSYRHHPGEWEASGEGSETPADVLP